MTPLHGPDSSCAPELPIPLETRVGVLFPSSRRKGWCALRLSAWLALLFLVVSATALPAGDMAAPLLPGGITDPSGRTGFLVGPTGSIEALDLVTGDVLWTADARRPLFAYAERLYALTADGPRPRVRAFDISNRGERVFESEPLTLPEWASVLEGVGNTFAVRCRVEKGELVCTPAGNWGRGSSLSAT